MNEVNSLETELRSWKLRQPSEKIKRNIFAPAVPHGKPPITQDAQPVSFPTWGWLAPMAACLFIAMAAFNQHDSLLRPDLEQFSGTTVASNQSYVLSPSNTFEWTNEAKITSSVRSLLTNGTK